jgi:hypothetical protein
VALVFPIVLLPLSVPAAVLFLGPPMVLAEKHLPMRWQFILAGAMAGGIHAFVVISVWDTSNAAVGWTSGAVLLRLIADAPYSLLRSVVLEAAVGSVAGHIYGTIMSKLTPAP